MTWRRSAPATCWAAEEATKVIPVEAESPSDAVFLATHTSIPVFQRDLVTNATRITKTDENALLAAVLEQPADQPILPILGRSGTGKSHLVRWLRARLPETDTRRVVFVPKHRMSLRGILDLILDRADTERAAELRQKVAMAVEAISDVQEAKLRLRNELAVLIETRGTRTDVPPEEQELRGWLASSEGLPALLSDPVFRDRIFDNRGPISRLAREKLTGKGAEDKEEAFGFTAKDLTMTVDDTNHASTAAAEVASALASDQGSREIAARMLNEQLNPAVSQVFGIGGDDLKELLVEVRVELQRQNLELLLLIEDFSIFQGIQGGLLDAITLIPTRDNGVCPMRVVMAVTSGYFIQQMPDTVYTRVYKVFDLDDPSPKVSFPTDVVASRYLNAIRVGTAALEEAHRATGETPNACEQCPVNDACHVAFGAAGGYGLFPFNRNALDRAVRSKLVDERLSVRDFLTRVLRPVLFNQHDEIDGESFPNATFDNAFRAGAEGILDSVEDEHRLATPGDAELSKRRVVLVRYWGDEGVGPQNLRPTIHEAFGIPPLEGLRFQGQRQRPGTTPQPGPDRPPQPAPQPEPQPSVRRAEAPELVRMIDSWRATGLLRQTPRNNLRGMVHSAVRARLMLEDGLGGDPMWIGTGRQWDKTFEASTSIAIGEQPNASTLIAIDRESDEDVRALRALAWVNAAGTWRAVENGVALQRVAEEKVAQWATVVSEALFPERDQRDDSELAVAANALLAMSKTLGISDAFKGDALSRTRALFTPTTELDANPSRPKLRQWQLGILTDSHRLNREQLQQRVLRLASFTQGAGSPLALDLPRVTKALRGKGAGDDLPVTTGLLQDTAITIRTRLASLAEVKDEASVVLPDLSDVGGDLVDVCKRLEDLVAERANAGQLPGAIARADLTAAGKALKQGDQNRVQSAREKLNSWDQLSSDDQVRLLTDDWDDAAARVRQVVYLGTRAVDALEQRLGSGAGTAAQVEYEEARETLVAAMEVAASTLSPVGDSEPAS